MSVIAVINRKGGSGKSTVATHIAAWLAHEGEAVMLGDVDVQQSSRAWLRRRARLDETQVPPIQGWRFNNSLLARPPSGVRHMVIDTPGGLTGFDLARLVMGCDAIVMPVCDSSFDREAAAQCHAELMALPRLASRRCRLGVVGMRIDRRTRSHEALTSWAAALGMHYLGSLRDAKHYVAYAERGLTLFDMPPRKAAADLEEWAPLLDWLREAIAATPVGPPARAVRASRPHAGAGTSGTSGTRGTPAAPALVAESVAVEGAIAPGNPPRRSSQFSLPSSPAREMPAPAPADAGEPGMWARLRRLWGS